MTESLGSCDLLQDVCSSILSLNRCERFGADGDRGSITLSEERCPNVVGRKIVTGDLNEGSLTLAIYI